MFQSQKNIWYCICEFNTLIASFKRKYKNREKGKEIDIAERIYELSVQLKYVQHHSEIEEKLPLFDQNDKFQFTKS